MAKMSQTETECPNCGSFIDYVNGICSNCGFPKNNEREFSVKERLERVRELLQTKMTEVERRNALTIVVGTIEML